jgi:ADP-ribosylation factor GTPase-activating protein 1
MDAFKANEIERMRLGGNEGWRTFFEEHEDTKMTGVGWEDATIAERYSGEVGEEWKERLTAKVEGREYVKGETQKRVVSPPAGGSARQSPRTGTPLSGTANRSDSMGSNGGNSGGKVKVDDRYFAKLGADNAARSADVPPSQGGKYAGFGNTPAPAAGSQGGGAAPSFDELQKDPVAALTKGFGWFTSTVSKTAKTVNDGYIQPTAKQVSFQAILFMSLVEA